MTRFITTGIVAGMVTLVLFTVVSLYAWMISAIIDLIGEYGAIYLTVFLVVWAIALYDYSEERL
jgi:hypothetical protein